MTRFPHKFYLRAEDGVPDTPPQSAIRRGLWLRGVETVDFTSDDEIDGFDDLGPDVGVAGYVGTVHRALRRMGRPLPPPLDYPPELGLYFGREITRTSLGAVRRAGVRRFIKPAVDHKLFTGYVWADTAAGRAPVVTLPDHVEVWSCGEVQFRAEYRVFVLRGQILDCSLYRGDWAAALHRGTVEHAVKLLGGCAPAAYCVDFGVLDGTGRTALVEMNDGFAFGPYGLAPSYYTLMIGARWRELSGGGDV